MKLTNYEVLQAQNKLAELSQRDDIPIRASLDIAIISNMVDVQVKAYSTVLQTLYKKYSVKAEPGENTIKFTCTLKDEADETGELKSANLQAFLEKLDSLLEANTADIQFNRVKLPSDIKIKPEILKALTEFVEIA